MAAEEATKASQANVMLWEEMQEQPSDDSSNRDESVKQSEMSVVEQQVEEPGEWMDEEVSDAKVWYDRNARQRTFVVGEQVLVLFPAQKDKLLAEWQGPYTIHKRITDATYEIFMPEK